MNIIETMLDLSLMFCCWIYVKLLLSKLFFKNLNWCIWNDRNLCFCINIFMYHKYLLNSVFYFLVTIDRFISRKLLEYHAFDIKWRFCVELDIQVVRSVIKFVATITQRHPNNMKLHSLLSAQHERSSGNQVSFQCRNRSYECMHVSCIHSYDVIFQRACVQSNIKLWNRAFNSQCAPEFYHSNFSKSVFGMITRHSTISSWLLLIISVFYYLDFMS